MTRLSPSEIIKFRVQCYMEGDGAGVYSLYSTKSDLCKLFTTEDFTTHFHMLTKDNMHAGLKIVTESVKGSLAEVKYIEHISENGRLVTYYSKTVLTFESDSWKILKEKREQTSSF